MNPLALRATNLRSYPSLEFEFPDGITAVTGSNGAGKSTLLAGIELALFAGVNVKEPDKAPQAGRDFAPALGPFADRLEITLVFEHDSTVYRVRRGYRAGGSATLDLEVRHFANPEQWESITKESTAATQALLTAILGLSRRTFNASAFLAQGNASAFPEANPSDRKAILGEILDPRSLWPRLASKASDDRKQAEHALAAQQARISDREPLAAEVPDRFRELDKAGIAVALADTNYAAAEETYEAARSAVAQNEAAAERYRAARAAEETARAVASKAQQALGEARQRGHEAGEARGRLAGLAELTARVPGYEQKLEDERAKDALRIERQNEKKQADYEVQQQRQRVLALEATCTMIDDQIDQVAAKHRAISEAPAGTEHCDRCQQILGEQAREAALGSLGEQATELANQANRRREEIKDAERALVGLQTKTTAIVIPEALPTQDYSSLLAQARRAQQDHAALAARLEALEQAAAQVPALEREAQDAEGALRLAQAKTEQARGEHADPDALEQAAERTRLARSARRVDLDDANQAHTRAETALHTAQAAARELADLRRDCASSLRELATYRLAERAYGRDGVPALIAENTVGVIEAEANRVLKRLRTSSGTTFRVELRTQKALKSSDALRETLDILVSDRTTTREFLTFSGGERFRVSFALRWALAKLLAGRRGAESRLLVIDEPDGLDAGGMDGLAAVLRENADVFSKVLLVSHNPLLASAFEQVVEVTSDGDVSRLAA